MTIPTQKQRLDEWKKIDAAGRHYHLQQWKEPKRSTISFAEFILPSLKSTKRIMDIGCGAGSVTSYLAAKYRHIDFIGLDYSDELVKIANELSAEQRLSNLLFGTDDWFNLKHYSGIDGVLSLQTLSWLPQFEEPLQQLFEKVSPEWIAISSLFYEGDISCKIEVEEHVKKKKCFYNVYSLSAISRFADDFGYKLENATPFIIDIDIPRPSDKDSMGTYTVQTAESCTAAPRRLQISGPLLMNWYFIMLRKKAVP